MYARNIIPYIYLVQYHIAEKLKKKLTSNVVSCWCKRVCDYINVSVVAVFLFVS